MTAKKRKRKTFRFPSNGKAYINFQLFKSVDPREVVSIPFKRESIYQLRSTASTQATPRVSIPFKRESIYQPGSPSLKTVDCSTFQFPSNGKAYINTSLKTLSWQILLFQFPSNGKAYINNFTYIFLGKYVKFQFPSNGKAYINGASRCHAWCMPTRVSIPFKRESIYQRKVLYRIDQLRQCVSIPFKRESIYQQPPISTQWGRGSKSPKP